jgi:16S rRNA pseudouridine516 synthase
MRLDKYLCHATGLTRSRAQVVIRRSQVMVNGEVKKRPDFKLPENAVVTWHGERVNLGGKRYYMLNKPSGVVSAAVDARHKTVLDLFDEAERKNLHIAGRLDIDATGLVLLTDDGDWSHRVTSPKHNCDKVYRVEVAETLDETLVARFAEGLLLRNEEKKTRPATLEILDTNRARLTISEGKYHQVKRMFAALGNRVTALHRERIGVLELDPVLQPGEWRPLTEDEIKVMQQ